MRYWDASAIVPLVVSESRTALAREWLSQDPVLVTWAWTRVEIASAVERRAREGRLDREKRRVVFAALRALWEGCDEVTDVLAVRKRAIALLAHHPLRAADAAQLGAALLVAEGDPASLEFVCFDERLGIAAEKEGFSVLGG